MESFVAWAGEQAGRYELVDGHAVALMTGASRRHNLLALLLAASLLDALAEGPCRVYTGSQLVRTGPLRGRAPDVMVSCGPEDDERWENDAQYVLEILSPRTTSTDFSDKITEYRRLPSIRQYLVLYPGEPRGQLRTATDLGWHEQDVSGVVEFAGVTLDLGAIHARADAKLGPRR
jgi:Uma2 family endonuclease